MSSAFKDAIIKAISHEAHAAAKFISFAQLTDDPTLVRDFFAYAREELGHAISLMDYITERFGHVLLPMESEDIGDYDNLHVALIEYLAEEESAIFYYETLAQLSPNEEDKAFFRQIEEEENRHMAYLEAIISKDEEGKA